jgi:ATP-dependent DNA helicase RecQ
LRSPADAPLPVEAARLALGEVERHQTVARTRIDMMRQFAESRACRGQALLTYFGDRLDTTCGHCDNCEPRPSTSPVDTGRPAPAVRIGPAALPRPRPEPAVRPAPSSTLANEPYPPHSVVRHRSWGTGTVLGYEDDRMTVLFDTVGYKTLSVAVVMKGNLLATED